MLQICLSWTIHATWRSRLGGRAILVQWCARTCFSPWCIMMHQYNVIYAIYIMFSDVPRRNVLQGLSWIVKDLCNYALLDWKSAKFQKKDATAAQGVLFSSFFTRLCEASFRRIFTGSWLNYVRFIDWKKKTTASRAGKAHIWKCMSCARKLHNHCAWLKPAGASGNWCTDFVRKSRFPLME